MKKESFIFKLIFVLLLSISIETVSAVSATDIFLKGDTTVNSRTIYIDKDNNVVLINAADRNCSSGNGYKFGEDMSEEDSKHNSYIYHSNSYDSGNEDDDSYDSGSSSWTETLYCNIESYNNAKYGYTDIEKYRYIGNTSSSTFLSADIYTTDEEAQKFLEEHSYYYYIYQEVTPDVALFKSSFPIIKDEESEIVLSVDSQDTMEAIQFSIDKDLIEIKEIIPSEGWKYQLEDDIYYFYNEKLEVKKGEIAVIKIVALQDLEKNAAVIKSYKSVKSYEAYYPSYSKTCRVRGTDYDWYDTFECDYNSFTAEKTDTYVGFGLYYKQFDFNYYTKEGYDFGSGCERNVEYNFHPMRLISEEYDVQIDVAQKVEEYEKPIDSEAKDETKQEETKNPETGLKENIILVIFTTSMIAVVALINYRKKIN